MPNCRKILGLYHDKNAVHRAMQLECCQSLGHEGPHEWHVWSDADNKATSREGCIQVIHGDKA